MARKGVLYMGSLEPYMDENFIHSAFRQMEEHIWKVEMVKDKSGQSAHFCFVHFTDDFTALSAMHKLNDKLIPGSRSPVKFNLSHTSLRGRNAIENDYSLYIGHLSPDVDSYTLFKTFACKYSSVIQAYVKRDKNGFSKGFGFVRFAEENEQKVARIQMNRFKGIGSKTIIVNFANDLDGGQNTKTINTDQQQAMAVVQAMWAGTAHPVATTQSDYSHYYNEQYWQNSGASAPWINYASHYYPQKPEYYTTQLQPAHQQPSMIPAAYPTPLLSTPMGIQMAHSSQHVGQQQKDDNELVEYSLPNHVADLNTEIINRADDLREALDDARWLPTGTF